METELSKYQTISDCKQNEMSVLQNTFEQKQIDAQRLEQQVNDLKGQLLQHQLDSDNNQVT